MDHCEVFVLHLVCQWCKLATSKSLYRSCWIKVAVFFWYVLTMSMCMCGPAAQRHGGQVGEHGRPAAAGLLWGGWRGRVGEWMWMLTAVKMSNVIPLIFSLFMVLLRFAHKGLIDWGLIMFCFEAPGHNFKCPKTSWSWVSSETQKPPGHFKNYCIGFIKAAKINILHLLPFLQ